MEERKRIGQRLKPGIPRSWLLFLAALTWTFAGGMLVWKGVGYFPGTGSPGWKIPLGISAGLLFYVLVFRKLSRKHSRRILELEPERPCMFSFFSWKSYLMMGLMITMGVSMKHAGIIPEKLLLPVYFGMGIPLLLSSLVFFRRFFSYF